MSKVTVITLFLAACVIYGGEALFGLDGYSKLNDHLVDKVKSTDLAENIKEARALINSDANGALKKAAALLVSLDETAGRCDHASYEALRKNVEETKGAAQSRSPPLKRVDNLVYQYAVEHAAKCPAAYVQQYQERSSQVDPKLRDQLERISDIMSEALISQDPDDNWEDKIHNDQELFNLDSIGDRMDCDKQMNNFPFAVLDIIRKSGKDDPDVVYASSQVNQKNGEVHVEKGKVTQLYEKYLLQPCKAHAEKMGDLYEQASFDFKMNPHPYRNRHESDVAMVAFKRDWTLLRVCDHIVNKVSRPLLAGVIKRLA